MDAAAALPLAAAADTAEVLTDLFVVLETRFSEMWAVGQIAGALGGAVVVGMAVLTTLAAPFGLRRLSDGAGRAR